MKNSAIDKKSKTQKNWENHINVWKASNLTIAEYARQAKIATSSFHLWKSRLLKEKQQSLAPQFAEISLPLINEAQKTIDFQQNTKKTNFILQIKDYRLEIPYNFDKKTLSSLLDCLDGRGTKSCV